MRKISPRLIYFFGALGGCLLYTSDAADEEDSVDLGGRRLIKKKIRDKTSKKKKIESNWHTTLRTEPKMNHKKWSAHSD